MSSAALRPFDLPADRPAPPPGTIGFVLYGAVPAGSRDLPEVLDVVEAVRSLAVDALPGTHTTATVTIAGDLSVPGDLLAVTTARSGGAVGDREDGGLVVDLASRRVVAGGGEVTFTYLEFELLAFLVEHRGRVFSRAQLLRHVWGQDRIVGGRTVDVHVKRVRTKIRPEHGARIETVRGVGYRFAGEARIVRPGEPLRITG
jgi:DNA-binding winged helix-turn-helix (wHTH) protein